MIRVKRSVRPPLPQPGAFRTEKFDAELPRMLRVSASSAVVSPMLFADDELVVVDSVAVVVVVTVVVVVVVVVDVVKGGVCTVAILLGRLSGTV